MGVLYHNVCNINGAFVFIIDFSKEATLVCIVLNFKDHLLFGFNYLPTGSDWESCMIGTERVVVKLTKDEPGGIRVCRRKLREGTRGVSNMFQISGAQKWLMTITSAKRDHIPNYQIISEDHEQSFNESPNDGDKWS